MPVADYDDAATMRAARARYFDANGLGEGGYAERWVRLEAGPLALYMPNTQARVRAVRFHDLHHVVTGYETTWTGEAEIAAWEIASGCADHWAAWLLNLQAMAIGLALAPSAVVRAFARGRRSANLYRETFDARLLDARVGDLRRRLRLDAVAAAPTLADRLACAAWSVLAAGTLLATAGVVVGLPALLLARVLS